MSESDEQARKARADALRKRISEINQDSSAEPSENEAPTGQSDESPRHFVERRMRELAEEEDKEDSGETL